MDKNRQRDYARRVSQANRTELVVVTYEIILEELALAQKALASGEKEEARNSIKSAQKFLAALMSALDHKYTIARNLMSLYEYVQRILVASDVGGEDRGIASAVRVIDGLRVGFEGIVDSDDSGSVMENSQDVYAGLTYGRLGHNEMNLSDGSNRGFLA